VRREEKRDYCCEKKNREQKRRDGKEYRTPKCECRRESERLHAAERLFVLREGAGRVVDCRVVMDG